MGATEANKKKKNSDKSPVDKAFSKIRVIEHKAMVRKPKFNYKPEKLQPKSQVDVIQRAAENNAKAGDKSVGQFTRVALEGGLRRGDVKFRGVLGFKSESPETLGGTVLKKDFVGKKGLVVKAGELHPFKPRDVQVARTMTDIYKSVNNKVTGSFTSVARTVDKKREDAGVYSTSRKEALKSFETGTGERPKDKRRRRIRVFH